MRKRLQLLPMNWCWGSKVSENKAIELQTAAGRGFAEWFRLCLETRSKQDHAGIYFSLEILTVLYVHIWFYDVRHWNYEKNRFYLTDEEITPSI